MGLRSRGRIELEAMNRIIILFLLTGCAYGVPTTENAPVMADDAGVSSLDAAGSDVYAKPEPQHVPDAMPPICHVGACHAFSDGRVLGPCDPCGDAGELCKIDGEYGVCEFH